MISGVWDAIQEAMLVMSWQEVGATIFSIIYVILAAKENIWCWFFGLIGVILSLWVYIDVQLYSDASLQVFYIGMSIYGWITWSSKKEGQKALEISQFPLKYHLALLVAGTVLAAFLGVFWQQFGAALPFIDAFTTSFSIIATFLVARKILENWLYWIVIDFVCIFVYWHREIYLFSFLFLVYCIIAIVGYINWKRSLETSQSL